MTENGKNYAQQYIERMDPEIRTERDKRRKIAIVQHKDYAQIRKMQHIEKYISDPHQWAKRDALIDILRYYQGDNVICYFNTKEAVRYNFNEIMRERNLPRPLSNWYLLDGDCNNMERRHVINNFRRYGGVLFTTDLMNGAGISLNVNIIINIDK